MNTIRKSGAAALIAAPILLGAGLALADTCIDTRQIKESHQVDNGKALLFSMKDGTTYRNNLRSPCPDLVFNGYVWVIRNPDNTVCDNVNTIRVLQSGEICMIGAFQKVSPQQSRAPG
jgi:hypothetical protein